MTLAERKTPGVSPGHLQELRTCLLIRLALIPRPLLPQGEGEEKASLAFEVPRPEGEGFRVRARIKHLPLKVTLDPFRLFREEGEVK